MKKITLRFLSFFLSILLFSTVCVPCAFAADEFGVNSKTRSSGKELIPFDVYCAEQYISGYTSIFLNHYSTCDAVYDIFKDQDDFQHPIYYYEFLFNEKFRWHPEYYYEVVLWDMILAGQNKIYSDISSSFNEFSDQVLNGAELGLDLQKEELKNLLENTDDVSELHKKYQKMLDKLELDSSFLENIDFELFIGRTAGDALETYNKLTVLKEYGGTQIDIWKRMKENTKDNPNLHQALSHLISLYEDCLDNFLETLYKEIYPDTVESTLRFFNGKITGRILERIGLAGSVGKGIWMGMTAGSFIADHVFSTNSVASSFLTLKSVKEIDDAFRISMTDIMQDFKHGINAGVADSFLNANTYMIALKQYGIETTETFILAIYDGGLGNKGIRLLNKLLGKTDGMDEYLRVLERDRSDWIYYIALKSTFYEKYLDEHKRDPYEGYTPPEIIPVESLELSVDDIEIVQGETRYIRPVFTPDTATDQRVTYAIEDEAIAVVSSFGVVTGVKEGVTTLTVTSMENGAEASCIVRVGPPAPLDICFVIDTTGSMGDDIDNVKAYLQEIIAQVSSKSPDYRIGLVDYRDFPERTGYIPDYPSMVQLPFTSVTEDISTAVQSLSLGNGGDYEETVYSGIMRAVATPDVGKWRADAKKTLIVMGDAPPLDPEPYTNYTFETVVQACKELDAAMVDNPLPPVSRALSGQERASVKNTFSLNRTTGVSGSDVNIMTVATSKAGDTTRGIFDRLADETLGVSVSADSAEEVADVIIDAIDSIELPTEHAEQVVFSQENLSLSIGQVHRLTASIIPEDSIEKSLAWLSDNEKIVSVDASGTIEALSAGKTIIHAQTANGKTAECTVTVTDPSYVAPRKSASVSMVSVPAASLLWDSATIPAGGVSYFTVITDSSEAPKAISANPSVASVSYYDRTALGYRYQVTGVTPGTAVITLQAGSSALPCRFTATVAGTAALRSDTTVDFTLRRGSAYCFKFTLPDSSAALPSFTVGNGGVLKTQFVARVGNECYFRVWAVGAPGQRTGVYTQTPGELPIKHCTVTVS